MGSQHAQQAHQPRPLQSAPQLLTSCRAHCASGLEHGRSLHGSARKHEASPGHSGDSALV
jgi:hypothetical protein